MKKNGASTALLTPDAYGWRVRLPGTEGQIVKTLDEAAAAVPAGRHIHLALPCHTTLLERLTLPSTNRDELAGMVQLQLEKTLPYPVEEVTNDFEVIRQGETDSTLLSISAHQDHLDLLCAPLRSRNLIPYKVTLFAAHVAASCPPDQVVLCLWQEEEQLVAAISERGKLSTAQVFPGLDEQTVTDELPSMLLRAEMEGVPVEFDSIQVEHGCGQLRPVLADYFQKPVELVSFNAALPETGGNLLPGAWRDESRRLENSGKLKQRLQVAAFVYLLIVAAAFIYLAWMKTRVRKIDVQLAQTRPQTESIKAAQARWEALAPAVDPNFYAIEVLNQLFASRPGDEVKFNTFEFAPSNWVLIGEAPTPDGAIQFGEKLKGEPTLTDRWELTIGLPEIVDGKGKFNYSGRR